MLTTRAPAMPKTKYDTIILEGGLDLVTPRLQLKSGVARRMVNYECGINGGYSRVKGYERYDGRLSPSSVTYQLLPIVTFAMVPGAGISVTGTASRTTATVIAVGETTGQTHFAVTNVSGPGFQEGEFLELTGVGISYGQIGPQTVRLSKTTRKQYVNLAADVYRALILKVPGSGPVRGVFGAILNGSFAVYAFRDKADGTECLLYKATPTGWTQILFTLRLEFYNGFDATGAGFLEGTFIKQFGDPAPYLVQRVMQQSGSWRGGSAAGWLVLQSPQGGSTGVGAFNSALNPQTFGAVTFSTRNYAGAITQQPGGVYEFDYYNFSGRQQSARIYGCDGANNAFEFDGEVFAPIATGIEPTIFGGLNSQVILAKLDRPTHIKGHEKALFLSIGSSFLFSGPGTPYNFTAVEGGGEVATGDTVTGFKILPGSQQTGSMAVMGRNHSKILYGSALAGTNPFHLVNFQSETGALPGTIQELDRVYYLDDRGVIDLRTAQEFGNFVTATMTRRIQPYLDLKRGRAICSTVNGSKSQYRLYFLDGTGLFVTLDNGKLKGCAPVAFPHVFSCAWTGEDADGAEHSFVGSRDGYVFEMERGTSFDGQPITADLLLNWNHMGSPRQRKSLRGASVEFSEDTDYVELKFASRLGPELTAHHQDKDVTEVSDSELNMQWDHFTWDTIWYDGTTISPQEIDVKGTSERVQYLVGSSSDYLDAYTLTSIITRYFPRRGVR